MIGDEEPSQHPIPPEEKPPAHPTEEEPPIPENLQEEMASEPSMEPIPEEEMPVESPPEEAPPIPENPQEAIASEPSMEPIPEEEMPTESSTTEAPQPETIPEESKTTEPPIEEKPQEPAIPEEEIAHVDFDLLDIEGRWLLKVLSGPNTGAEFAMHSGSSYFIGTDTQSCDIIFQDLSVSRKHARLTIDLRDNAVLEDLQSRNGTFVDGERITTKSLSGNVLVSMGTTTFLMIDREAERTTIVAPSIHEKRVEEAERGAPKEQPLQAIQEAVLPPMQSEVERVKEEERVQAKVSHAVSTLVILAIVTGIIFVIGIGAALLFRTEEITTPSVIDPDAEIAKSLSEFPSVRYSFNPSTARLMLVGHVLTSTDRSKMLDNLQQLKFLKGVDYNNVVIDEFVRQEINQVIAKNPAWASITITSPSAGRFILTGFLKTKNEAEKLYDYLSQNFAYVDLLQRRVVVEEEVLAQLNRELSDAGFKGVTPALSGGDLALTGSIVAGSKDRFEHLVSVFKSIPGIRSVQDLVAETGQREPIVDISSKYSVTGYSQQGKNVNVVINGKILSPGDTLDGMFITEITQTTVFLEKDGVKYKIEFNH